MTLTFGGTTILNMGYLPSKEITDIIKDHKANDPSVQARNANFTTKDGRREPVSMIWFVEGPDSLDLALHQHVNQTYETELKQKYGFPLKYLFLQASERVSNPKTPNAVREKLNDALEAMLMTLC